MTSSVVTRMSMRPVPTLDADGTLAGLASRHGLLHPAQGVKGVPVLLSADPARHHIEISRTTLERWR